MKIDILTCLFSPEAVTSARTSTDLAEELARKGHQVRVIAPYPNRPGGKVFAGYKRMPWMHDKAFQKFQVLRVFSLTSSESGLISRFMENISFGISGALAVLFLPKADVLYGNTWPIFAQGLLALVCRLRGIPLVVTVQDIYPESLSIQSRIQGKQSRLFRLLRWIDQKVKQSSAAVVVISERFRDIYIQDRRVPAEKIHVIPNWIDEGQVELEPRSNHVRRSHDIPEGAFLVVYAGNIGAASGLDAAIRAFQNLHAEQDIYLLVAGSGSKLHEWRNLAQAIRNPRVLFHTPWLESETSGVLAAASLFILPTYGNQALVSVPSKLITYMLAERPVLCCAAEGSELAEMVRDSSCGWVVPAGDAEAITRHIRELSRMHPGDLRTRGINGRNFALQHMTRSALLPRMVAIIENTA